MTQAENTAKPLFTRKQIVHLVVPLLIENFLMITVGIVDSVMISAAGETAVSGVSLVQQINVLLTQLFTAFAAGGAVVVSQYLGRRDRENACKTGKQLVCLSFLVAAVLGLITILGRRVLLAGIYGNVEPEVMRAAEIYLALTSLGYPFLALYNAGSAIFRSMGNTKVSLIISFSMNVTNMFGNAVLIYGVKLGVAGAAISTFLSQVVAGVLITLLLNNPAHAVYLSNLLHPEWNRRILKSIMMLGIPTGIENSIFEVGKLLVASLTTTFGTAAIAANAIAGNLSSLAMMPGGAIGLGMITVAGQCVGAGDYRQARRYTAKMMWMAELFLAISSAVMFVIIPFFIGFYHVSEQAAQLASTILRVNCVAGLIWVPAFATPNALRAAGDAKFTMAVSIASMCVFRVGFSYLLGGYFGMGLLGVWAAMYIDWAVRGVFFMARQHGHSWEKIHVI